jgi:hypothetical protein
MECLPAHNTPEHNLYGFHSLPHIEPVVLRSGHAEEDSAADKGHMVKILVKKALYSPDKLEEVLQRCYLARGLKGRVL